MTFNFKAGWQPDVPDMRDYRFVPKTEAAVTLPPVFDLSSDPAQPPIYNQRRVGVVYR